MNNLFEAGVINLSTQNELWNGKNIVVDGVDMISFGSCSYLGLETREELKNGAIDAVRKYGTQFSSSRIFMSNPLYDELEELLKRVYGYPTVVAASTTLAHISCIPIFVSHTDAIIIDRQAHTSIFTAVLTAKANGTYVETLDHNNRDRLQDCITRLSSKYDKIWYMADGIYSMFGDSAPLREIIQLLNTHDKFHLYIDDAHGMGWVGKNGSGHVLSQIAYHPKMVLISSLNKSFSAAGGAIVCKDEKTARVIRTCGNSLIFSGPVQPPMLGAAVASAKIHLRNEIYDLQSALQKRISFFIEKAAGLELNIVNKEKTPIFFIGIGPSKISANLCKKMMARGFFLNLADFPAVPHNMTGVRIALTVHHTLWDIAAMMETLAHELRNILKEENLNRHEMQKAFYGTKD